MTDDGTPADETTPTNEADFIGTYKRSKFLAERAVLDLVRQEGLPAVVVNPSAPVGPRDIKPTPTGKMIRDAAAGRVPAYIDTGLNMVHVDDVAEGHALALERGRIGERYMLGGENLLLKDILALVAEVVGPPPAADRAARGAGLAGRLAHGRAGAADRHPADDDARPHQDGAARDVLLLGQGDAANWAMRRARCGGDRGRGGLVPRQRHAADMTMLAALSLLIWLYLLLAHGRFWQSGPELAPGASGRCAAGGGGGAGARRGAADRRRRCARCWRRTMPGRCASSWWMTAARDGTGAIARAIWPIRRLTVPCDGQPRPAGLERQAVGGGARAWRRLARPSWSC